MQRNYKIRVKTESMHDFKRMNGLMVGFVVKGSAHVRYEQDVCKLNLGDVFVVNHRELYQMDVDSDSVICYVQFYMQYLSAQVDDISKLKFNISNDPSETNMNQLRSIIARACVTQLRHTALSKLTKQQLMIQLLLHMIHYVPKAYQNRPVEHDSKIDAVCEYIELHFHQDLSLSFLSEFVGWSESHLSKRFKSAMGMGFQQYLNETRIAHAKLDLQYSEQSMMDVALTNGFTSAASFSRTFKQFAGETPKQFRETHKSEVSLRSATAQFNALEIIALLNGFIEEMHPFIEDVDRVQFKEIEFNDKPTSLNPFHHLIQVGYLKYLLNAQYQAQLIKSDRDFGVQEILVNDPMPYIIRKERSDFKYDAQISNVYYDIDRCLDFLLKHDFKLTIHLDEYRDADYIKSFKALLYHMALHTYNEKAILLNLYVTALHPELVEIVDYFKSLFRHGGLYVHINQYTERRVNLLKQVEYAVTHFVYDANSNDAVDFDSVDDHAFHTARHMIANKTGYVKQFMKEVNIERPLILLNWNTLTGNTFVTNGEYFRGGIIMEQLMKLRSTVSMIGYWLNYDLHVSHCRNEQDYMNAIELFHQYNGKRPVYYTAMLSHRLTKDVLYEDDGCIVTGNDTAFQLLIFDAQHFNPYLALDEQMNWRTTELIHIKIKKLEQGMYKVKHFTLDKENGELFKQWRQHHTKHGMDQDSIDYVNRMSYPKLEVNEFEVIDDLLLNVRMITNAIHLIEVSRYPNR